MTGDITNESSDEIEGLYNTVNAGEGLNIEAENKQKVRSNGPLDLLPLAMNTESGSSCSLFLVPKPWPLANRPGTLVLGIGPSPLAS